MKKALQATVMFVIIFACSSIPALAQNMDNLVISGSFNPSEVAVYKEATSTMSADIYTDSKDDELAKDVISSTYTISVSGGTLDSVTATDGAVTYSSDGSSATVSVNDSSASVSFSVTIQSTTTGTSSVSVSGNASLSDGTSIAGSGSSDLTVVEPCQLP